VALVAVAEATVFQVVLPALLSSNFANANCAASQSFLNVTVVAATMESKVVEEVQVELVFQPGKKL
jgi:hypothetical protein